MSTSSPSAPSETSRWLRYILGVVLVVLLFLLFRPLGAGSDDPPLFAEDSTTTVSAPDSLVTPDTLLAETETETPDDAEASGGSGAGGGGTAQAASAPQSTSTRPTSTGSSGATSASSGASTASRGTNGSSRRGSSSTQVGSDDLDDYRSKKRRLQDLAEHFRVTTTQLADENDAIREEIEKGWCTIKTRWTDPDPGEMAPTQRAPLSIAVGNARVDRFDSIILEVAAQYGIDPLLLKSIVKQESDFRPHVENPRSSATGLGQMIVGTYRRVWPSQSHLSSDQIKARLKDPEHALRSSARYLGEFVKPKSLDRYDMFYNYYIGEHAIECLKRRGPDCSVPKDHFKDATKYANDCMGRYRDWARQIGYEWPRESA